MSETLREKLDRLRAEKSSTDEEPVSSSKASPNVFDTDLVPEIEPSTYTPTPEDAEIDRLVGGIDILEAYRRWCGKMQPKVGNKRENIMISCPRPDHADKNPSAFVNLDKQVWRCARCEDGGDTLTLVARTKGYEGDSYQQGKNFPALKREMAEDLGFVIRTTPGGEAYALPVEVEADEPVQPDEYGTHQNGHQDGGAAKHPAEPPATPPIPHVSAGQSPDVVDQEPDDRDSPLAPIAYMHGDDEPEPIVPRIEWMAMVAPDTFLYDWMNVMRHDDLPDEFYFWHGLLALGLAVGRDAVLADRQPVTGNLFICLYGPSGQGKTRSTSQLSRLLREALPYDKSDPDSTGAYMVPPPGSPEALIDSFSRPVPDDSDPKIIDHYGAVRGLVRFDELATLIGRASRSGNPLKPVLQQFYDADPMVATSSRGHGDVEAHNAFCSVVTTTQPKAIRSVLIASDVDSGFANRWVYVMGHSKPPIPFGGVRLDIDDAVRRLKEIHSWAAFGRSMTLTPAALERWEEFYASSLARFHSSDDAMTSRLPLLMKKLMLLLAVNAKETSVSFDTVESVIMLFPYLKATFGYLSGDLGTGERLESEQAVIKAIEAYTHEAGKAPTARDVIRRMPKSANRDSSTVRRVLDDLVAVGLVDEQVVKHAAAGRPTTRYIVKEG